MTSDDIYLFALRDANCIKTFARGLTQRSYNQIVYIDPASGMCNRFRTIAALKVICNLLSIPFKFVWSTFENQQDNSQITSITIPGCITISELRNINESTSNYLLVSDQLYHETVYEYFRDTIQLSLYEFDALYRNECNKLITTVIRERNIHQQYTLFAQESDLCNYTSLHIRRRDYVDAFKLWWPDRTLPSIDDYIKYVHDNVSGAFFLSTDCIDVQSRFTEEFGDHVKMHRHIFSNHKMRSTSFDDALLDLYTLTLGNVVVGTPNSSFSEFAYYAGNNKLVDLEGYDK